MQQNNNVKFNKIIIDGNNLYHRNYYVHKDRKTKLQDNTEIITGGIYGFIKSLEKIEREFLSENGIIYYLWDNPKSKTKLRSEMDNEYLDRLKLDPNYKLNRNKQELPFYRGMDYLRIILQNRNNNYIDIQVENYEADDFVKPLVESFSPYDKVLVVSEDFDYSRTIKSNVFWYAKKQIWDVELFKNEHNYTPIDNHVQMYKAIRGDDSDNIPPGIPGLWEELVLKIIDDYVDIYDFLTNYSKADYLNDTWKNKIKEQFNRIRLNYQLVDFIPIDIEIINQYQIECKKNVTVYKKIIENLGFKPNDFQSLVYTINVSEWKRPELEAKTSGSNFFKSRKINRI